MPNAQVRNDEHLNAEREGPECRTTQHFRPLGIPALLTLGITSFGITAPTRI